METDQTKDMFKSQFAREIAESEDFVERFPHRRRERESIQLARDGTTGQQQVGRNGSLLHSKLAFHNFGGSVGSLPSLSGDGVKTGEDWVSPQEFREILDKKERSWRCSSQVKKAMSRQRMKREMFLMGA